MALYTCILQNQIDIYHQILIKMLTREPVAFFCYFSSFELMTKGKKEIFEKIQNLVQQNHYWYYSAHLTLVSHTHTHTHTQDKHWLVFLAGGFAGIFSWITTYPQVWTILMNMCIQIAKRQNTESEVQKIIIQAPLFQNHYRLNLCQYAPHGL